MKSFKGWSRKFISDNTPYGDISREIKQGRCVPTLKSKEVTIHYLIESKMWNASSIATISEMLDLYYEEVVSKTKSDSLYHIPYHNYYPIQKSRWNE